MIERCPCGQELEHKWKYCPACGLDKEVASRREDARKKSEDVKKRNNEIRMSYKSGESFRSLSKRYGLSVTRIATICKYENGAPKYEEQETFKALLNAAESISPDPHRVAVLMYAALKRAGFKCVDYEETATMLSKYTDEDLLNIRGVGLTGLRVIRIAFKKEA